MAPFSEESVICKADPSIPDENVPASQESGSSAYFRQTMPNTERRLHRRLGLHWRLRLSSTVIGTVETRTENLSSHGFYCILEAPLVPGDVVACDITIPNYGTPDRGMSFLACQAEVIRVEAVGTDPGFGVACRILDFTLTKQGIAFRNN